MTTEYRSQGDVARWCGVTPAAVSNWLKRHPDTAPAPDVEIVNEDGTGVSRGWLAERRPEWEAFSAARHANPDSISAGAATRRNRRAAEVIYRDMQSGKIDPATAAELLHELI